MPDESAATRAELLAIVERSPDAAGRHDRPGWVGLFSADGVVEDPVGSRPHRGRDELGRFYDTFIGPRDITFHRDADIVVENTVVRDLELEVRMSPAVVMRIPAILRYDVDPQRQVITRLQAHWELPAMVLVFARSGPAALPVGLALARSLVTNQGVADTVGFASGFGGVGRRGKRTLCALLADAAAGDELAVRRRCADNTQTTLGSDARLATTDLVAHLVGGRVDKVIAAGRIAAAGITNDGRRSVVIAEFGPRATGLTGLRLFTET